MGGSPSWNAGSIYPDTWLRSKRNGGSATPKYAYGFDSYKTPSGNDTAPR